MSINKVVLVASAGIIFGTAAWYYSDFTKRHPASTAQAPAVIAKPWAQPFGKMNQAMTIVIKPVNGVPDRNDQELTLRAEVTLHRSVAGSEVQFQWELPEDAEVVAGHISDSWSNLQPGQTATTEISVVNVSKEGAQKTINLQVSAMDSEVKYAVSGSFATNDYKVKDSGNTTGVLKVSDDKELGLQNSKEPEKILKLHQ
jgi:hypothetical protein